MKRYGQLFGKICSFDNLLKAARKAQRGKRLKTSTSEFNLRLETELLKLQKELQDRTYRIGRYKQFYIYDPKKRLISALPYRDRVAQHALCNVIEPIFDQSFIHDTYACRKDKGSHSAVNRFTTYCRMNKYALKCDIKSYFASIDHDVLFEMLKKKTKDPNALWLIKLIIDSTLSPGIPIGNLASQIFANLYLDGLDHYLKETVKCKYYLRYMDDLIVFDNDKGRLNEIKGAMGEYLRSLKLELHPNKSQTYLTAKGIVFLGYKVYPTHRLVVKQNVKRLRKRIKRYFELLRLKLITPQKIICSVQSWLGYAIHADSFNLRRKILSEFNFKACLPAGRG
ncbi:RNA-dependent DNA polymerase [Candidatus Saganbacteria bacterium]|nr:RNA-dependent DNA polymerase [Candidatus Saganbacteria bacterium]